MTVEAGWQLAIGLVALGALGTIVGVLGRLEVRWEIPWAAVRATVQLTLISLVVGLALRDPWLAWAFVTAMFLIGVVTSARRAGLSVGLGWAAAGLAMAAGAGPVLTIIFLCGAVPWTGEAIVPVASILVGNTMSAHTLVTRRAFLEMREAIGQYEALLALGFPAPRAISELVSPTLHEGLIPGLDQTRTVGLVTLPGAFIGVILGGGSPVQAAAAQALVLIGANAGQACTAVAARALMARGWLLPADLKVRLRP